MTSLRPDPAATPEGGPWSSPSALRYFVGLPDGALPATGDGARAAGSRLARHPRLATASGLNQDNVISVLDESREALSALGIVLEVVRRRDGCVVIRTTPKAQTPGRAACELSKALLQGLLEENRDTHSTVLETTCVERGADACLYTLLWNPTTSTHADDQPVPSPPQPPVSLRAGYQEYPKFTEYPEMHPDPAESGQVPETLVFGSFGLEEAVVELGDDEEPEMDRRSSSPRQPGAGPPRLPRWLWRHSWILVVTVLAGTVGGWFVAGHEPVSYVAQATLVVQSGATGSGPGSANEAGTLATTYAAVIPTDEQVLRAAGAQLRVAAATVSHSLSIVVETGTSVLLLKYSASRPARAIRGAAAVAEILGGPTSASAAVPTGSIAIVHLPDTANQPGSLRNYGMPVGAVLGLLIGVILVFAAERSDPRAQGPTRLHEADGMERNPELGPSLWSGSAVRASA